MCVQLSRDNKSLYLRRSLINLRYFRIPKETLDRIFLHISVAAEDLHRLVGAEHGCLACEQFGHRACLLHVLAAILRLCGEMEQRPASADAGGHIRELELDCLKILDRRAELTPLRRVSRRRLECSSRDANRLRGNAKPSGIQRFHRVYKAE